MKWVVLGADSAETERYGKLNERISKDLPSEVEFQPWTPGSDIEVLLKDFKHVRFSHKAQLEITKGLKAQSAWTTLLGVADGMVRRDDRWWPLCAAYEAFSQILTGIGQDLDTNSSAFVAGSDGIARAAVAALFKVGFRRFRLVAEKPDDSTQMLADLRHRLFGIDMEVVPISKIVLLGGISSLFVNTVSHEGEPLLMQELSYLNFLKRPGAIVDSNLHQKPTLLLKEAADSGLTIVDGLAVAARMDSLWLDWAFGLKIPSSELQQL